MTAIVCDTVLTQEELAESPLPDPEDNGIEIPRKGPLDGRPPEDPEANRVRLAEMEALQGSGEPSDGTTFVDDSADGDSGHKWKIWVVLVFAILAIALGVIFLR